MNTATDLDYARYDHIRPILWTGDALQLLDQRKLPFVVEHVVCHDSDDVATAIHALTVRGAPAIGIAAAWGVVLAAREVQAADGAHAPQQPEPALQRLNASRPTAVNLAWALARMRRCLTAAGADWKALLEAEAQAIAEEDLAANRHMGALGAGLIEAGSGVLTHCNTGSLATAGFGTALGVIRAGMAQHRIARVFAGETRPWLQGSRLRAWERANEGLPVTLCADSALAHLMKTKGITWVVVGADCIAANGDVASKIGTYQLAVNAMHHGVRFMVVAPSTSIDLNLATGEDIPLEERYPDELLEAPGERVAAVEVINPVFDVTPADLIDAIVSERGVIERPDTAKIAQLVCRKRLH